MGGRTVLEKSRRLHEALLVYEELMEWTVRWVEVDDLEVMMSRVDEVAEARETLTHACREFDQARNAVRLRMMALLRDDLGIPVPRLSRIWGVSRQLVAQHLHQWDSPNQN